MGKGLVTWLFLADAIVLESRSTDEPLILPLPRLTGISNPIMACGHEGNDQTGVDEQCRTPGRDRGGLGENAQGLEDIFLFGNQRRLVPGQSASGGGCGHSRIRAGRADVDGRIRGNHRSIGGIGRSGPAMGNAG